MTDSSQPLKFLTIRQPWASLIAVGAKTIETRPFSTKYRGPLAIHAGKTRPAFHNLGPFTDVTGEPIAEGHDLAWLDTRNWPTDGVYDRDAALVPLPLGAVVAVCDLVDVVPIVGGDALVDAPYVRSDDDWPLMLRLVNADEGGVPSVCEDQLPFGDFTPGRYAWLLESVRPLPEPIPMRGAQGLRDLPTTFARLIEEQIDHLCRNKRCVNPAHLEAVTQSENAKRAIPFANRPKANTCDACGGPATNRARRCKACDTARRRGLLDNIRPIDPVPMKGAQGLRDVPADIAAQVAKARAY